MKIAQLTEANKGLAQYAAAGAEQIASLKNENADLRRQLEELKNTQSAGKVATRDGGSDVCAEIMFQCHMNYGKAVRETATALAIKHDIEPPYFKEYKRSADFANERTYEVETSGDKAAVNSFLKELRAVLEKQRGKVNNNQIFKLVQPPSITD